MVDRKEINILLEKTNRLNFDETTASILSQLIYHLENENINTNQNRIKEIQRIFNCLHHHLVKVLSYLEAKQIEKLVDCLETEQIKLFWKAQDKNYLKILDSINKSQFQRIILLLSPEQIKEISKEVSLAKN